MTHKDSEGKENLKERYDDENCSTLVHFIDKTVMQVGFAELRVPISLPANDFLMRKSLPPNLPIFLQGCSHAVQSPVGTQFSDNFAVLWI
jgi:hypothetical protein